MNSKTNCVMVLDVALALALSGCGAGDAPDMQDDMSDQGGAGHASSIETVSEQLDTGWTSGPFPVGQNADRQLESDSTHVCVLTKVSGHYAGGGEMVQLLRVNGFWRLRTQSQQEGVGAEAFCFMKSGFQANGSARWTSNAFSGFEIGVSSCSSRLTQAWQGDATTYVSGLTGPWDGGCEFVGVNQAASGTALSQLVVGAGMSKLVEGFAQSFFAGTPSSGVRAKFFNSQTFSVGNNRSTVMAPTDQAMCHFTEIRGDFNGGGEFVQILPVLDGGVEKWQLLSHTQSGGGVTASARCYLRDQR
jgi:hypothetical protein